MEMVDMVITRIWFSNRKSRRVTNSLQQTDLGMLVGLEASRPTCCGLWRAEHLRKKGSYIFAHECRVNLFISTFLLSPWHFLRNAFLSSFKFDVSGPGSHQARWDGPGTSWARDPCAWSWQPPLRLWAWAESRIQR